MTGLTYVVWDRQYAKWKSGPAHLTHRLDWAHRYPIVGEQKPLGVNEVMMLSPESWQMIARMTKTLDATFMKLAQEIADEQVRVEDTLRPVTPEQLRDVETHVRRTPEDVRSTPDEHVLRTPDGPDEHVLRTPEGGERDGDR